MKSLSAKRVLLGITGGIAAYKCAELTRLLVKSGAEVRVVMTPAATEFITPLTMQALSGNRVHTTLLDADAEAGMGHIELARWADLILVAPATADFIATLVTGKADNILSTLVLASKATIAIAPAMNQAMWSNPATQENLEALRSRDMHIFGPASGEQACGDVGLGRMLEPQDLLEASAHLFATGLLAGTRITITAGPTQEAIDPVRYISNRSSGKMAYALAAEAANEGAIVSLISGPVSLPTPERVQRIDVLSARDMLEASLSTLETCDVFIGVAAVADYRPETVADNKIKKSGDRISLDMVKNPDIIATVANSDLRPFTVGFAAETQDIDTYGRKKLESKNLDMLFANDARSTLGSDSTSATAFWRTDNKQLSQQTLGPASKNSVAREMLKLIAKQLDCKGS
ncbi:MAG: bifunctional phosphopantothenoylcysteine decarboxylase/phosphopantothenate--cysteine ligase CoaBC [Pseudohongiellaceae bacterium]|nr:bifunctional phosphopantothenoylcysteine decarboxylase/phosphopantothenate--cysteine ligase CoaBC [Pseudohongiellaceae bacterium]